MGKLSNLLKWHKTILVKDERGVPLKDGKGKPVTVTIRIIGDRDLEEASKIARLASYTKRLNLANVDSDEYKDEVGMWNDADKESCIQMIMAGEGANWSSEALSNVERPDLPTLESVSLDPDAPSLAELEKLDSKTKAIEDDYRKRLTEYTEARQEVLLAELQEITVEDARERAKQAAIIISSIETYLNVLLDEKVWRAVYSDDKMTQREFNTREEFDALHTIVKNLLRLTYQELESGIENIKN